MKKRILSLMLVLVLAVSLLTVAAAGANRPWEDAYRKTIKSTVSKYGWNIMLADIDMDGVPELQFGSTPGTGLFSYVEKMYTFRNGAVQQIKLDGRAYLPILDGDGYTAYRNDATGMLKVEVTWFVRDSASVFINNTAECSLVNDVYSAKPTFSVVENNGVKQYGTGGQWVSAAQYNALYAARIQGWSLVGALPTASSASAVYNKRITDADIDKLFADYPVGQAYTVSGFRDVLSSDYYAFPVIWAASHDPQITNGTTATTFSPNSSCTRGQVVTFLWRANGCPEPRSTSNPFADVDLNAYYGKAVLWAVGGEQHHQRHGRRTVRAGRDGDARAGRDLPLAHAEPAQGERQQPLHGRAGRRVLCRRGAVGGRERHHERHRRQHVQPGRPLHARADRDLPVPRHGAARHCAITTHAA